MATVRIPTPLRKYTQGNDEVQVAGNTVREVIEVAREVTGRDVPAQIGPRRPGDPAVLIASSEKIDRELGWKPQHQDLRAIVRSAWNWMTRTPPLPPYLASSTEVNSNVSEIERSRRWL